MLQDHQQIADELITFFNNAVLNLEKNGNPYIIYQVSDDISDLVERCINKYQFHPSILIIKKRIRMQNSFSFYAIERVDMMRKFLSIDTKKAITGNSIPSKILKLSDDVSVDVLQNLFNDLL